MKHITLFLILFFSFISFAQNNTSYWQQHANYTMSVDVNARNYTYSGTQKLIYTNNSPDTLYKVFYHLYFNAFQPGSEMDIRLQNIVDPDTRMVTNIGTKQNPIFKSKIATLKPNEIGFLKVKSLTQNGKKVAYHTEETVLEVTLAKPILPGEKTEFYMEFEGQVPKHIRRAGRNSKDGVALTMAQWYPKMAEYDFEGWHAHPYISREFHGIWGNFDVTLYIDKKYTVAGTGILVNPNEVGHGYVSSYAKLNLPKSEKLKWHFKADKVIDFTWAADPNYVHDIYPSKSGIDLHFFYKKDKKYRKVWKEMQPLVEKTMLYFNKNIGPYPWKQYSVIQGGDGGMEYAMCTLIAGGANGKTRIGTVIHEIAHSWFQHLFATNESKYPWIDEGFTEYISTLAYQKIVQKKKDKPSNKSYKSYYYLAKNNLEEPLTTHADRYSTNTNYSVASYVKGRMFLTQLNYIIGTENVAKTLKQFYTDFKFTHPTPNDFKRTAEKVSGIHLDWYLNEWIQTTNTIDYGVSFTNKTVNLKRIGKLPMPIDIRIVYDDNTTEDFYIPLNLMRGEKPTKATILKDWSWGKPNYSFTTKKPIKKVVIDPSGLLADVNKGNNVYPVIKKM